MTEIRSKVAYLQGLAQGLDIESAGSEGKILASVIEVLGDLVEYVEDVDHDLGHLEESLYVEDEPSSSSLVHRVDGEVETLSCPQCGETLAAGVDLADVAMTATCPVCGFESHTEERS